MYGLVLWCFSEQVSQIYINLIVNSFRGALWRLLSGFKGDKLKCYVLLFMEVEFRL